MKIEKISDRSVATFSRIVSPLVAILLLQKAEEVESLSLEEVSTNYDDYRGKKFLLEDFLEEKNKIEGIRVMVEVAAKVDSSVSILPFAHMPKGYLSSREYEVIILKINK